jgi:hypothetical protein
MTTNKETSAPIFLEKLNLHVMVQFDPAALAAGELKFDILHDAPAELEDKIRQEVEQYLKQELDLIYNEDTQTETVLSEEDQILKDIEELYAKDYFRK